MKRFFFSIILWICLAELSQAQELYLKTKVATFKLPYWIESAQQIQKKNPIQKRKDESVLFRIKLSAGYAAKTAIEFFENQPETEWVEEVVTYQIPETQSSIKKDAFSDKLHTTPNDPDLTNYQPWLETLQASRVWAKGEGSRDIVIAIIDTGVDYLHEDLADNRWINTEEIPDNGIDDDGNGFVDDVNGWDFYEKNGQPLPKGASNNHGTHVAGLASAVTNNGIGMAALSFNTRFMPIKTSDNDGKNLSHSVEAIYYAVDNGADIINCSWGSTRFSKAMEEAVDYAWENGVLITAAAGNSGNSSVYYPAGYARVIAVGAIDYRNLKKSSFSNYGGFVDVLAPGGETDGGLYSTLPHHSYGVSFGTSMASPLVASALGIIRSLKPEWDISTVRSQLETTSVLLHSQNPNYTYLLGNGLIQPADALENDLKPHLNVVSHHFGEKNSSEPIFNRNETVELHASLENLGINQQTLKVNVQSMSTYVSVVSGNGKSYQVNHSDVFEISPISIKVSADAPVNTTAKLRLEFVYDDGSSSFKVIEMKLVPDNQILSVNSIELGVNGYGRIGFFDYPNNQKGSGFVIKKEGTTESNLLDVPLLREGGLLMGTSSTRISSAIRGNNNQVDNEFVPVDYFESFIDLEKGIQKGNVFFTDLNAGVEGVRFDILTTVETFAPMQEPDHQYVLLKYTLKNTNETEDFSAFRAGLFFDFDMPFSQASDDIAFYDSNADLIAQFSGGTESDTTQYVGLSIVEGISIPWIIDNDATDSQLYFGISYDAKDSKQNGFTDQEKWLALSSQEAAQLPKRQRIGPANTSFVVSPEVFKLDRNQEKSFTVVIAQAIGYEQLVSVIDRARTQAEAIISPIERSPELPEKAQINSIFPNPFNPQTSIRFDIAKSGHIYMDVTNILGQKVAVLTNQHYASGTHYSLSFDGRNLTSGMYFVRLFFDGNQQSVKKMMLIK